MENAAADNMTDYLDDLQNCRDNSLLEELDELNLSVLYRRLLENSTAYMLMCRCGLEPDEYFDPEDFSEVFNFNTPESAECPGRGHTGYCRKRFERHRIDRPKPSKANSHNCAGTGK